MLLVDVRVDQIGPTVHLRQELLFCLCKTIRFLGQPWSVGANDAVVSISEARRSNRPGRASMGVVWATGPPNPNPSKEEEEEEEEDR